MSSAVVGQRWVSEREPELGLGVVTAVDAVGKRLTVEFPAAGERRLYALGTEVLRRVRFREGDSIGTRDGTGVVVEAVEEADGVLTYVGGGRRVREDAVADATAVSTPPERLLAGQAEPGEVFDLRLRTLEARARLRQSEVRGFLGGRIDLIPHQFYILHEVAGRQIPRVLLADEVGLGKTIEACLIVHRLLAVGRARRVLVLVPESLVHQWFVELLRRFNLWFSIYDETRCVDLETADPGQNPFHGVQWALTSIEFLAQMEARRAQAIAAGWDVVVVDEAHHLAWSPQAASPEYALVEALAARTPGLLLLTATPTQLGLAGHFARLRLLDPERYGDYDTFVAEAARYAEVAGVAGKIVDEQPLTPEDGAALRRIFGRAERRLAQHLEDLARGRPDARRELLRTLLDQYGTGRVVFRNTRAAVAGFPPRRYCPVELEAGEGEDTLRARLVREFEAEEAGGGGAIRHNFKDDPRVTWLADLLAQVRPAKVLAICKSQRKVLAFGAALQERTGAGIGLFHEGLPLVQRDRQAAWFAEAEGAQVLVCSEIGSEGRNFQFAHHLVLLDLPTNPGRLEQRIGRLDRIGQTDTIQVHVPVVAGGPEAVVADWYHRGLDAFERTVPAGGEGTEALRARLVELAVRASTPADSARGRERATAAAEEIEALIAETARFRAQLAETLRLGRDRLLELASLDQAVADRVIGRVRAAEEDLGVRRRLFELLDHFGVRLKEHEGGDVFIDPGHAYTQGFPALPAEGMLATFDRRRAMTREDIRFLSADHPLIGEAMDLLLGSPAGTTAFGIMPGDTPNLLVEAVYVLEAVAEARWHVDEFLAPTPVRVLVDVRGRDLTEAQDAATVAGACADEPLARFLERPGFNAAVLKAMLEGAAECAEVRAEELRTQSGRRAEAVLAAETQRLEDLRAVNDHVRPVEVALSRERQERTAAAIAGARLRLDALRLVLQTPERR